MACFVVEGGLSPDSGRGIVAANAEETGHNGCHTPAPVQSHFPATLTALGSAKPAREASISNTLRTISVHGPDLLKLPSSKVGATRPPFNRGDLQVHRWHDHNFSDALKTALIHFEAVLPIPALAVLTLRLDGRHVPALDTGPRA